MGCGCGTGLDVSMTRRAQRLGRARLDGQVHEQAAIWNPAFLNERTKWPTRVKPCLQIGPSLPMGLSDGSLKGTSLSAWKGVVCPMCGRCNSRIK